MSIPDGYDAMGHPIPANRMGAAYRAVKSMITGISTEDAMTLVGRVGNALERDEPYLALRLATGGAAFPNEGSAAVQEADPSDYPLVVLDVTGAYRLLAHLLTGPS